MPSKCTSHAHSSPPGGELNRVISRSSGRSGPIARSLVCPSVQWCAASERQTRREDRQGVHNCTDQVRGWPLIWSGLSDEWLRLATIAVQAFIESDMTTITTSRGFTTLH